MVRLNSSVLCYLYMSYISGSVGSLAEHPVGVLIELNSFI